MTPEKIPMGTFRHSDCLDFVEISERTSLALVKFKESTGAAPIVALVLVSAEGRLRYVGTGEGAKSLSNVYAQTVTTCETERNQSVFSMDPGSIVSMKPLTEGGGACIVTRSDSVWSIWRLLLSQIEQTVRTCTLCMTFPNTADLFDATWVSGKGVIAVCVTDESTFTTVGKGVKLAFTKPSHLVMKYTPTEGWLKWTPPILIEQSHVSDIKLSPNGSVFVVVFSSDAEVSLVHSSKGLIWTGKSIDRNSLRVSHTGQFCIWRGVSLDLERPRSSHSRLFVFDPSQEVTAISPAGALVICSDFFSRCEDVVWFTVQSGISLVETYLYDVASETTSRSGLEPITSPTATRLCYKTESLKTFPSIALKGELYPLPTNLECHTLQSSQWRCSENPRLEGIMYSSALDSVDRPVLIYLHGGPSMALSPFRRTLVESTDWFLPLVTEMDVLTIAFRGTLGFGDEFSQSSIGKQGIVELEDIVSTVTDLSSSGRTIAGILGSSYGGFLTLHAYCSYDSSIVEKVPKFIALYPYVSSRGCAAETGDFGWETEYCGVANDNEWPVPAECVQPDVLPKLYEAKNLEKPLLLMHGDNDNVCPVSQSRQAFNILRQRGAGEHVDLIVYRGEGHGFRDLKVREDCIKRIMKFLVPL